MIIRPKGYVPPTPAEIQRADVLRELNGLLEYSINPPRKPVKHTLVTLRTFSQRFVKALSDTRRAEFLFPIRVARAGARGSFYQVLSILRREDNNAPISWDSEGLPTANAKLIDNMCEHDDGRRFRFGWYSEEVTAIFIQLP